ncbi:MAG: SDR family oxidoreductase [Trebonia sp.]
MTTEALPLAGKSAIVTGAARSIGRETALALARDGASVTVHYHSRKAEADQTVEAIRALGAAVIAVPGDLTDPAAAQDLFAQTAKEFGGVDIVVANAAATTPMIPVAEITDESYRSLVEANTMATFNVLREAARQIRDGGRIVNVSSSSVHFRAAGFATYASTKAAALITTGVLAVELGHRAITANSLIVGPVADGFMSPSAPGVLAAPPGVMDYVVSASPMGRMGEVTDIAPVVAFLASPAAGWINGQQILVNNGGPI